MTNQEDKVNKLNQDFQKAFDEAKSLNAEKRSFQSLYLGNHFNKMKGSLERSLDTSGADSKTKIRIVENHTFKINEKMINSILSSGADVSVFPHRKDELQDIKAAELHQAVLEDWKSKTKFKRLVKKFAKDFVVDGEMCRKIFWNPNKGPIVGHKIKVDEEGNQKTVPVRAGEAEVERFFAWDLRVPKGVVDLDKAPWLGIEKMINTKELKSMLPEEIRDKVKDSQGEKFRIYDPITGTRQDAPEGMTVLREMYIRPCEKHPNGYYYFFNKSMILFEGELPEGLPFPIKVEGFLDIPTTCRHVSINRQLRPLQMQINFSTSQEARTLMTLGHDKVIMLAGADLQYGGLNRGIEKYKTNAIQAPVILSGRSGEQFVNSKLRAIEAMYRIASIPEQDEDKEQIQDQNLALFREIKHKKRWAIYAEKFHDFIIEIIEDVLTLKKMYMSENQLIKAVGRSEAVNIAEFKAAEDIFHQIKVNEVDGDAVSQMGQHITLTNMLQYGGKDLSKEATALIGRNMPFNNAEEIFNEDLTNYDQVKNMILALDRGELVEIQPDDNVDYIIPKIMTRTREASFKTLSEEIRANYKQTLQALSMTKKQQLHALKLQQSELYPTTGNMVPIPIYEEVPNSRGGTKFQRAMVPQDALQRFYDQLGEQNVTVNPLKQMDQGLQAKIANQQQPQESHPAHV